jgi:hypothetical protein
MQALGLGAEDAAHRVFDQLLLLRRERRRISFEQSEDAPAETRVLNLTGEQVPDLPIVVHLVSHTGPAHYWPTA